MGAMKRREFLGTPAMAALAAGAEPPSAAPDSVTNPAGLEYFILGNGRMLAGVQWTQTAEAGAQAGIVLMSPEHLNRKTGSLLWHARAGLGDTRAVVVVEGKPYTPEPGAAQMAWEETDCVPTVSVRWRAGTCEVAERLWCAGSQAALVREVEVTNRGTAAAEVLVLAVLRGNGLLFDEYESDRESARVEARGYHRLQLAAAEGGRALERGVEVALGRLAAEGRGSARFVLTLEEPAGEWGAAALKAARTEAAAVWRRQAVVETGDGGLDAMFRAAGRGLRSAVAASGKMDGGLWGYNLEWVRDSSMVAASAVMAGHVETGEAMLDRVLTRLISESGAVLDSSLHRPPETMELDQNGQVLWSLWTHWAWTGSDTLIRKHWKKIRAAADLPLRPEYRDARTGLVKNTREFWERSAPHGVREGYESAYQCWNVAGWEKAAEMARRMGDGESAARWAEASRKMRRSFVGDERFGFIREGRLVKRLLADGTVQKTLEPPRREALAPGMPLREEAVSYCDPDAGSVYPLLLGIVDARGEVGRRTLDGMETLWNQRWTGGGYGRYHVTGEPDSPGPWPFASLFIARAWLEAGEAGKAMRVLRWMESVPGGRTGTWFEYYGPRPVPPLPPVAVIPWIWAEVVTLMVHHVVGVRPDPEGLTIRPRLLEGLDDVRAAVRVGGHPLHVRVRRGGGASGAFVDGRQVEWREGEMRCPRPEREMQVEIRLQA